MKKMVFIMASILMVGVSLPSCKPNDAKTKSEVENVLRATYNSVSSSINEGVVTLSGTVNTEIEKTAAGNAARSVKNVKSVINNITVKESASTETRTMAVYNDAEILSAITSKFNAEGFNHLQINVSNGEVTLSGDLKRDQLTKVMQIVNEAKPRKVNNNLTLK